MQELQWTDFPRTKDKLVILGFAETSRHLVPWDQDDYELWIVNEEYTFPWVKRFDRLFQIHPRWDFTRTNNLNDPNHFLWLKNETGLCNFCSGRGFVVVEDKENKCNYCVEGIYTPVNRPANLPIYMQKSHPDIPNSIRVPLDEMTKECLPQLGGRHYYTSTIAYMLGLAYLMGYKRIELYGFEMGTDTEYHYQRSNAEYWIGWLHAKGIEVYIPDVSPMIRGPLYGYDNMRTGYRQQMEMRLVNLRSQYEAQKFNTIRLEGAAKALNELRKAHPDNEEMLNKFIEVETKRLQGEGLVNFINGCITETQNLMKLYDCYFIVGTEQGDSEAVLAYEENAKFVNSLYQ